MALQYTTVDEKSFAFGIDARSAENQIREGFVRDLVNADIIEGRVRKRKGHVSYAGNIPVRVLGLRYESGNKICFTLDSSIDLSRVPSTPILVYGRSSLGNPFSSSGGLQYYTGWTTNLKKTLLANTTSTISAPQTEHGLTSPDFFTGTALSTGTGDDLSGEVVSLDGISISASTYDITASYTNGEATNKSAFLYYLNRTGITGETYISTQAITTPGTKTFTIPAATHQLANYNIVPQLYLGDNSVLGSVTTWSKIQPDSFSINITSGQVVCTFTISEAVPSLTAKLILSAVPFDQAAAVQLSPSPVTPPASQSVSVVDVGSPLIFGALYEKDSVTNTYNLVFPDNTTYNDTTKALSISYTKSSPATDGIYYYNYGTIRANELCVTHPSAITPGADTSPQLTIWGLDHTTIYSTEKEVNRRGWVTHVDSYRSPASTHLVAGLGGNFFAALTKEEMVDAANVALPLQTAMPTYYARLQSRLASAISIGPLFWDTTAVPFRTRGTASFYSGGTNWATITSIAYQTSTGYTRYTMSVPGLAIVGGSTISDVVSTTPDLEDWFTVKSMSHSKHNGTFKIKGSGQPSATTIWFDVENDALTNIDYDDSGTEGLGGVFTDQITFTTTNEFIENDILLSSLWGEETNLAIKSVDNLTAVVQNIYEIKALATGLLISGKRTSATVALRNPTGTSISTYLVAGDTINCSAVAYPLTVTEVDSTNHSITFDQPITWYDDITNSITYTVSRRWIPREMPLRDSGDVLINDKISRYFANNTYDNQPFLRSAMVQNNLYLTNGDDEVYKYDGLNTYRAGIIPWQPGLFAIVESVASGGIPLASGVADDGGSGDVLELVGGQIRIDKDQAAKFSDGDTVIIRDGTLSPVQDYVVTIKGRELESSGNHYLFSFVEPLPFTTLGSGVTVQMIICYFARYYFRLNLKDRNGVTIASAVTGAKDFVVQVAPTNTNPTRVHLRLVGLPAWDHYDYSNKNIEVETYRTYWSTTSVGEAPAFYRLPQVKTCAYTGADGYLDVIDTYGNNALSELDSVVGALGGTAVAAAWDETPRAKYLTTAGNRLVLANLTDWPTLGVQYVTEAGLVLSDFAGQTFTFRRDAAITETSKPATDMSNYVTYELVNGGGSTLATTAFASVTGGFSISFATGSFAPGDWVYIQLASSASHPLDFCGWWQIHAVSTPVTTTVTGNQVAVTTLNVASTTGFASAGNFVHNSITYAYTGKTPTSFTGISPAITANDGETITGPYICTILSTKTYVAPTHSHTAIFATNKKDVPVNINTDYNMQMFNGQTTVNPELRILRRVGEAINATMRMTDTTIAGYTSFRPWLTARSESDVNQLLVKQPRADDTQPALTISGATSKVSTYVNGSKVVTTGSTWSDRTQTISLITRYPSRLAASYNNYPEIFHNLWTVNPDFSDSIIDVNSADGQEITGVIPFFGESAFGAALQGGVLVVFKQNSIYLVNLDKKAEGVNAIERLETQGLGCTAPYSIAPTKDGIAFANDSGIYVLRRNQRIEYLGRFMERKWQKEVDRNYLSIVHGHHYNVGRQYKLSVPLLNDTLPGYAENSEVYVYNHTGETGDESGGWGRYTNHPATGWANLFQDAFFATVNGSVMRLRVEEVPEDYRDGANAIEANFESRATDFGQGGIRKVVSHVIVNYRTGGMSEATTLEASPDLLQQYDSTTPFAVINVPTNNGFSTVAGQDVVTIRHSLVRRKCVYMTIRISNNGLDQEWEVAGMSYVVSGLTSKGITQAATTKKQSGV